MNVNSIRNVGGMWLELGTVTSSRATIRITITTTTGTTTFDDNGWRKEWIRLRLNCLSYVRLTESKTENFQVSKKRVRLTVLLAQWATWNVFPFRTNIIFVFCYRQISWWTTLYERSIFILGSITRRTVDVRIWLGELEFDLGSILWRNISLIYKKVVCKKACC